MVTSAFSICFDYPTAPRQRYQNFAHLPGFVVLESTDKQAGRYDIISAFPYDRFLIQETTPDKRAEWERLQSLLPPQPSAADLPFQGGAIGYISYDFGARLMGISSQTHPVLSDMPLVDLGFYDWAIIVDHHQEQVTLFVANRQDFTVHHIESILSCWYRTSQLDPTFSLRSDFHPLITRAQYNQSFAEIKQALIAGRCYQVNLTQSYQAGYTGDAWDMYQQVGDKNPVPFSAFVRTSYADVLSFSPERFLLYDKGRLLTSPIKGTIGRSADLAQDEGLKTELMNCEKNRAEHVMIVDLLRNDLARIAKAGTVQVTHLCTLQSFSKVHHLVSDITAECLADLHPTELFISCFPGGSITGAPKLESMKVINEQETHGRGIYCGAIGYFSQHGRFDFNIAIRTVTALNNTLHLAAGGGIVIDSQSEDEYGECSTKIAAIIHGIN